MLTSTDGARAVDTLRASAHLLNLGQCAEFEELFVQGLFLAPMAGLP